MIHKGGMKPVASTPVARKCWAKLHQPSRRRGRGVSLAILACLSLTATTHANESSYIVPELTSVNITWTSKTAWKGSLTYTAKPHPYSMVAALMEYKTYSPGGHKHYASMTSKATLSTNGSVTQSLSGTLNTRVENINNRVFRTKNPPPGMTAVLTNSHSGRGSVADDPECTGGFLYNTAADYTATRTWPTGCMDVPPPAQRCVMMIDGNPTVDLGPVQKGSRREVIVKAIGTCSEDGAVAIEQLSYANNGTTPATVHSSKVRWASKDYDLPKTFWFPSARPEKFSFVLDMSFPSSGRTKTDFVVVWMPK